MHAYEITHEIKNRKEDAFKREQKLIDEIATKTEHMKDQTRIILQHENSLHHLRNENEALRESNKALNHRVRFLMGSFVNYVTVYPLMISRPPRNI